MPNIDELFKRRRCDREIISHCSPSRVQIALGGGGPARAPQMAVSNDEGEALETSILGAPGYCLLTEATQKMFKACSLSSGPYNSSHDNRAPVSRIHRSKIDRAVFPDPPMEVFVVNNKFCEIIPMPTFVFVAMEILLQISSSSASAVRSFG